MIRLYQGYALSLYLLFSYGYLTRHIYDEAAWYILFAGDFVLTDKIRGGINYKFELRGEVLETKSSKLSRTRSEYMECKHV